MRRGITVIALIIVLLILAIAVLLLIPVVSNVRRAAARATCSNNLKALTLCIHNYHDTYKHTPAGTHPGSTLPPDQRLSFFVTILPYLESNPTYFKLKLTESWDSEANRDAMTATSFFRYFHCLEWMTERGEANGASTPMGQLRTTNYIGVAGVGAESATRAADAPGIGMFGYDRTLKFEEVKDGLANTMMLIETGHELGPWMRGGTSTVRGLELAGGQLTGDGLPFGGTHFRELWVARPPHAVAFFISLSDASVRRVEDTIDPAVLAALATVAGREEIPAAW